MKANKKNKNLSSSLAAWESQGSYLRTNLFDHQLFYRQLGDSNAAAEDTLLLIHGFPESSYSWHKVIDGLSRQFKRIVMFDQLGYGLSDKPTENYTYSLFEQADVAMQVWQQLGVTGGHLLAHDMGDSVATELVTRHVSGLMPASFSDGFQSFTFTNGSMVLSLSDLRVTQRILLSRAGPLMSKLSNFKVFEKQVRSAQGTDRLSDEDIDRLWENVCLQEGQHKNHLSIQYLNDRKRFEQTRWLPSLAKVTEPVHICWGEADAVARVSMAHYLKEKVCPSATMTLMPGVGHFCQISDPEIWLGSVLAFYKNL